MKNKIFKLFIATTTMMFIMQTMGVLATSSAMDPSFDVWAPAWFNADVNSIAMQSDGKIILGWDFTTYKWVQSNHIVRLNADDTKDTSFTIWSGFEDAWDQTVSKIILQADGKILVFGAFTKYNWAQVKYFARLNSDGSLDTSFESWLINQWDINTIAIQNDGKILIGGWQFTYNWVSKQWIARLNSDWSLDNSFDVWDNFSYVSGIGIQSDGKILISEYSPWNYAGWYALVRINADWSLDTSFKPGYTGGGLISKIAIQDDGKIIALGQISNYQDPSYVLGYCSNWVTEIDEVSCQNLGSCSDGRQRIDQGSCEVPTCSDPQYTDQGSCEGMWSCSDGRQNISQSSCELGTCSDSQYTDQSSCEAPTCTDPQYTDQGSCEGAYVCGDPYYKDQASCEANDNAWEQPNQWRSLNTWNLSNYWSQQNYRGQQNWWNNDYNTWTQWIKANGIIRLNSDGSVDTWFITGEGFDNIDGSWDIAIQADGKIIVGWNFYRYNNMSFGSLARLNNNWTLDTSFNVWLNWWSQVNWIWIKSNGDIVIGWSLYYNWESQKFSHINTDGIREPIFNIWDWFNGRIFGMEIQADGKILVGGSFSSYRGTKTQNIVRLNTDGSKDTSFAVGNGIGGNRPYVQILKTQSDGKAILAGNFTSYQWVPANNIVRVNTDGSRDTSFDIGAWFNNAVGWVAIQSDGKIIVWWWFDKYQGNNVACMVRLNADGSKDTSFTVDPSLSLNCPSITNIKVFNDGKILLAGWQGGGAWKILRLNANGSKDTSFNNVNNEQAFWVIVTYISSLAIQADGKLIIGGRFANASSGTPTENILRLNANWTRDNSFDQVGLNMKSLGWWNVNTIQLQNDGKILVGWFALDQQGLSMYKLSRLNTDGSKDTSFDEGILDNSISTLAQNSSGKVFFWWSFTSYNGSAAGYIMSLYGDTEMVSLPNSNDSGVVTSAFTSKWYTDNNWILNGSTPISLSETNGGILTDLGLSNKGISVIIPANTQLKKAGALNNYGGIISVPMNKAISTVNDQSVISAFKVGSTSQSIVLEWGVATLLLPTPGEDIGNTVNVYYSEDNAGSWYFQTQSTVIDHNGEPYIQFTNNHFTDFAITKVDTKAPIGTITYDPTSATSFRWSVNYY